MLAQHLKSISQNIQENYKKEKNIGVLSGISGCALFQFYYSKWTDVDNHADLGVAIIATCIDRINSGFSYPTYCDGIAGFGWAIQHLTMENFIDVNCDELLCPFDDYLFSQMKIDLSTGKYDFLHGALGYGFLFLKRYQFTTDENLKKRYAYFLGALLTELDELAHESGDTVKWEMVMDQEKQQPVSNLGLSHGMASIVNFLSRLLPLGLYPEKVMRLLTKSTRYIVQQRADQRNTLSKFPNVIQNGKKPNYNSRLAWCYGDLGIGISLFRAGSELKDGAIQANALDVLIYNSGRRSKKSTMVVDPGLCHGSYGNAQIFGFLNKEHSNDSFQEAADFWVRDGVSKSTFTDGYAGYKRWDGATESYRPSLCLLDGVAGIGLSMIDSLTVQKNSWDECLLIS